MAPATSPVSNLRYRGIITDLKRPKGFGFITHQETGREYFFHRSELDDSVNWDTLRITQYVEFEPDDSPRGLRALNVTLAVYEGAE